MIFNKYIALGIVAILVIAGIGGVMLLGNNQEQAPMNINATMYIQNIDTGDMMASNISLNQAQGLEMLTSVGGDIRSSDFQPLEMGTQNVNILSESAKYKVYIVLEITAKETGGTNYFDYIDGGFVKISAVGNQEKQPGAGAFKTGDAWGATTEVVWSTYDWLGGNAFNMHDLNTPYKFNQYQPATDGHTDGDFVTYWDKNLNKNLPIFGGMLDKSEWTVKVRCDFHVAGEDLIIPWEVDASFKVNVLDWYENHVSVSVTSVNIGKNVA